MAISSEEERLLGSSITHAIKARKAFVEANGNSLSTLHYNFIANELPRRKQRGIYGSLKEIHLG